MYSDMIEADKEERLDIKLKASLYIEANALIPQQLNSIKQPTPSTSTTIMLC